MSFTRALVLRKFIPGPEDPSEMLSEGTAILKSRNWLFNLATGTAGGLSGLMFVFLAAVFFWRRPLVNRVSLRLIALISLFDLLYCILQAVPKVQDVTHLRCSLFFIDFSFGSIYLSSSIAFNLQMVFLRKSRAPLPRYVEYLYYAVPLSVCLLHIAPQYIYAATRVMYSLYTKQRVITRVLNSVSRETHSLLSGSNPNNAQDTLSAASASSPSISASPKERQQLKLARRVYRVSVRIALYPLAPTVGLILLSIFYLQQYFVTLKYKSDVNTYVWLTTVSYFMFPVIAFVNFVIFLTDPAVLKVIAEVRHSIRFKMGRSDNFKSSGSGLHSPGRVVDKKASVTISESGVMSETMQVDSSSLISTYDPEKTNSNYQPDGLFNTPGALEESRPFVSVIDGLQDDAVMRRVIASSDGKSNCQDLL
ncbi:hypothetical protein GGI03_001603 [Coemansia sp. RSA 2337]|nr:hypothetical protein IW146_009417 [Coemansia sp. RSA 922]KAJ2351757.1 hypothetical protein GGH92_001651 [Coemansia sp. RSA 2673]KAJ2467365.1 hypothetical protein GGI03_001603 [Coemansia sp. RSA 2337]